MNGSGLFDQLRIAGWLSGPEGTNAADLTFRLLTRGRALNPIGRTLQSGGIETAPLLARQIWTWHHGADVPVITPRMRGTYLAALIHAMARVAHDDAPSTAEALPDLDILLDQIGLRAPLQQLIVDALRTPQSASTVVRNIHRAPEALLFHIVVRALRAPDDARPHPLHAAIDARVPLAPDLLARLDDGACPSSQPESRTPSSANRSPKDLAVPRPHGHQRSHRGLFGAI